VRFGCVDLKNVVKFVIPIIGFSKVIKLIIGYGGIKSLILFCFRQGVVYHVYKKNKIIIK